jgi:hypothetical protein
MKRISLFLVLLFGFSFAAKESNNALGIWVGRWDWGLDVKHLSGSNNVWDIYLGAFNIEKNNTAFPFDFGYYWLFNPIKADASVGRFPLHIGPDLGLKFESAGFGSWFNVAGGISWFTPTTPKMDVSLELAKAVFSYKDYGDGKLNFMKDPMNWRLLFHVYFF